jgi:membrane carboxypeptidase/penicillin-binding protein PbpC
LHGKPAQASVSRDAWAIGVTPEYTVGVWVGNSSGEGRPGLTGVTLAAPVMFEVFKTLWFNSWFKKPLQDMQKVEICKKSVLEPIRTAKAKQCGFLKMAFG